MQDLTPIDARMARACIEILVRIAPSLMENLTCGGRIGTVRRSGLAPEEIGG